MFMAGVAVSDVSQAFGCTRQTIHMLVIRYVHTGTVRDSQPIAACWKGIDLVGAV